MNKSNITIVLLFSLICIDVRSDETRGINWFTCNIIYGEENSPKSIYYKYINNNSSELFFCTLLECKDINENNVIAIIIIPCQDFEGILLIYNKDFNYLYQFSLIYDDTVDLSTGTVPLYVAKNKLDHSDAELVYSFLLRQNEYNYTLYAKKDLGELLIRLFPINVKVYIDKTTLSYPAYVRELE
jgi:hypothetical protein